MNINVKIEIDFSERIFQLLSGLKFPEPAIPNHPKGIPAILESGPETVKEPKKPAASKADKQAAMKVVPKEYPTETPAPVATTAPGKEITKEDIRAKINSIREDAKKEPLTIALIKKYSTDHKLSNVPAESYADMMAELNNL